MAIPFADIAFLHNPKNNQRQPRQVLIRQREYFHDAAIITIDFDRGGEKKYAQGSPVTITWGWLPGDTEVFVGYVSYTKTVKTLGQPRQLRIFCVGASVPLNQRRQRSYQKLMVGSIMSRIAKLHHLSLSADPSSRYHLHIPQLGQSDWNLAVRLAKDIGFTFGCRQTTLLFKRRVIDTRPGRQPVFTFAHSIFNERGAAYKVEHKSGSAPLADRSIVQVDGLDDQGNILTMVDTGDPADPVKPVFTKFTPEEEIPLSLRSIQEGKELLSGLSGTNRFYVIAQAELSGDPRVRPGTTIALQQVDSDVDGYWWTGSVDHTITPTSYTMEAEIGRETVRQTLYVPAPTSDAGKPEIQFPDDPYNSDTNAFPDDTGIENVVEADPISEYDPLDDCKPVEDLTYSAFGQVTSSVPDPFASPARQQLRAARPRPTRRRGMPAGAAATATPPRLNGWRSRTTA